jgi:hypothetical protein
MLKLLTLCLALRLERQVLSLNLEIVSHNYKAIWDLRFRDCGFELVSNLLILRCIFSWYVSD